MLGSTRVNAVIFAFCRVGVWVNRVTHSHWPASSCRQSTVSMNRTRVAPVVALCLVVAMGLGCHRRYTTETVVVPPTEVRLAPDQVAAAKLVVEPLAPQPVGDVVLASGRVTFDDLHVAHVLSPVTGRVVRIDAEPGHRVKKGDTLALVESSDVAMASSDSERAKADLRSAEKGRNRPQWAIRRPRSHTTRS